MNHHGGPTSSDHHSHHAHRSPAGSGTVTPTSPSPVSPSFLPSSFYSAIGGLMRRLSSEPGGQLQPAASSYPPSFSHSRDMAEGSRSLDLSSPASASHHSPRSPLGAYQPYSPPFARTASPLRPPPLEPLILSGFHDDTPPSARLLSTAIAEEIRIMVPERLRIEDEWKLVYSLDQDGASLATLYEKCSVHTEHRNGFVLVVQDQDGGTFGAYLSEYPHPAPHYFGTGECFLWRASFVPSLPPPSSMPLLYSDAGQEPLIPGLSGPSASTVRAAVPSSAASLASTPSLVSISSIASSVTSVAPPHSLRPMSSPSIRFSAYPYSGVNEYFLYCETHSLSIGGGDGKYGLWLDDGLEKGVSSTCLTFGNQPLSDEGDKFGVLGVEVWVIGSRQ
ncbi:tld domain containing protein [Grosmannia clavigera kw1407]|uniref:Oxidation resistance protein 1 n=1 Tax=Grosmannia clavigera (strain kw1407 / UAMH 11150) TaxID=655863 RepID=F0XNG4_GROCL|nr:tld domain containing protein [Grosmannia clavigera kw1407]EFX00895.1 tld domain containing protein [Grosmannia clavigera kw1407]